MRMKLIALSVLMLTMMSFAVVQPLLVIQVHKKPVTESLQLRVFARASTKADIYVMADNCDTVAQKQNHYFQKGANYVRLKTGKLSGTYGVKIIADTETFKTTFTKNEKIISDPGHHHNYICQLWHRKVRVPDEQRDSGIRPF